MDTIDEIRQPETAGSPGQDVIGTPGAEPAEEQVRAATALRTWDAMAQGA
jgi:hypothetical protein